jgi:hypothetical protein
LHYVLLIITKYEIMKNMFYVFTVFFIALVSCKTKGGQWENLIKKDLSNWTQVNGNATYEVKNKELVGTAVPNTSISFLCTKENFGDFILEYDAWIDTQLNSGVQIRSESRSGYKNGMVYGYQVDLDPSKRAWSGGICDESRRQWIYPLEINPEAKKVFKNNEWNHFRVEAVGNSIRTWLNGFPCADLIDDLTPSGFIGLQVRVTGKDSAAVGKQVKWKNMRIMTRNLDKYVTPYAPVIPQVSYLNNTLTEREVRDGWKLLWDGKTANGWRGAKLNTFPAKGWEIKDGVFIVLASGGGESAFGGDIVTIDKYKNFELMVDFLYMPKTNSGIKYFVDTELNKGEGSAIGCEYQILDISQDPGSKPGAPSKNAMAGLYDLIPPKIIPTNGPGNWNRARIIVKGNHVEHWLNSQMTVEYERGNEKWRELVSKSKFKIWPKFGEASEGNILLQDHGGLVSFRNIKIREIKD